jgi:opacity protein-like surface antigen
LIVDNRNDFLGQKRTSNTFLLEYDFTKRITAHVGYRFERREITQRVDNVQIQTFYPGPTAALANRGACAPAIAHPVNPDGTCTVAVEVADAGEDFTQINGSTGLIGFAARTDKLRASGDVEFFSGDNVFFRITPRHSQDYRFRAGYKAADWINVGAAIRILEARNTSADIGLLQHNRSYGFNAAIAKPDSIWGVDLNYDYNDIFSQTNICFVATPNLNPPGVINCGTPFLSGLSVYTNTSNYGSASLIMRPTKRITAGAGYAVTITNGNTLILNPIAPTGPLAFNYHLPTASIAFVLSEKVTFKSGWNYYDYNEKSNPGPTLPRDFRGNMFSLSLRYTM